MQSKEQLQVIGDMLVGLGVGYVVGLLVAPKRGKELRRDISRQLLRLRQKAMRYAAARKAKVRNWANVRTEQPEPMGERGA